MPRPESIVQAFRPGRVPLRLESFYSVAEMVVAKDCADPGFHRQLERPPEVRPAANVPLEYPAPLCLGMVPLPPPQSASAGSIAPKPFIQLSPERLVRCALVLTLRHQASLNASGISGFLAL
jgi:hypothetical protein